MHAFSKISTFFSKLDVESGEHASGYGREFKFFQHQILHRKTLSYMLCVASKIFFLLLTRENQICAATAVRIAW